MPAADPRQLLGTSGNVVDLLRSSQVGAHNYPAVPAEITDWRHEQRAWRETVVLYDQRGSVPREREYS